MSTPSSSSSQPRTYYTLLGIDQDATPKEIEKAYKRQALIHHPDRNPNESQTQSTNKFQKLAEAYEILRDPIKRRKYDLKVANPQLRHLQSGRPSSQPKRSSSTFDLFAYPGETPQYVPSPSRRPASTAPAFRTRPGSSAAQPTPPPSMSATTPNPPRPPTHRHSLAAHPQPHHHAQSAHHHQPFTQRINLKDLDSLDFILNMGLNPQARQNRPSNVSPSSAIRSQPHASLDSDSPPFHPTHSRNMSSSAPIHISPLSGPGDTVWTRSWIACLIWEPIAEKLHQEIQHGSESNEPQASKRATIGHGAQRPWSAGSDAFRDWLPTPNCTSPISTTTRPSKESRLSLDDDTFYLPSATYQSQARRMSTGNEKLYQPSPPRTKRRPGSINPHLAALLDSRVGTGDAFAGVLEGQRVFEQQLDHVPWNPSADYPPHHHLDRHRIRCMPIISLTIIIIIIIILRAAVEPQR
ncbi:hypothetical protein PCANC_18134 [Puccinia coronata f. sp. avenae]|uniref:J domain-containing protein n=1 Tax=Puccinia coronata f. sp. avenae TaxID=200324 RepID=A0A2N5SH42_9BASI|nr:hypothetical protein PCANC_18134 [Puccinia coronata f. sp. avenae]